MTIDNHYVAGRGTTAMSIIGTALGGLATAGGLLGGCNGYMNPEDHPVSRYELQQAQAIAAKDSEIALLKSEQHSEVKMADIYERLAAKSTPTITSRTPSIVNRPYTTQPTPLPSA